MNAVWGVLLNIIKLFTSIKHRAHLLDALRKMFFELLINGVLIIKDNFYVCGLRD